MLSLKQWLGLTVGISCLLSCSDINRSNEPNATSEKKLSQSAQANTLTDKPLVNQTHIPLSEQQFLQPGHEYKPLTWFHMMNANMSKVGISKDLQAIADSGIGGTILFNVGLNLPKGDVLFNSDNHLEHIAHMAKESDRLGLSFGIHNCDGWSSSGGPWITPEQSMKKVTWNETLVKSSGDTVQLQLKQPMTLKNYYQDIAVLAYPTLAGELTDAQQTPVITASDPSFDISLLSDVDTVGNQKLQADKDGNVWLQYSYQQPVTIRAAHVDLQWGKHYKYALHYSNDGINFKKHANLKVTRPARVRWALDGAFEGITAKHFRITSNKPVLINEVNLTSTARMSHFLARTSSSRTNYKQIPPIGKPPEHDVIDSSKVIDISAHMKADGSLSVNLPQGQWTIMRFGYTTSDSTNIPPTDEGYGLEVDKFSREAFKAHYEAYVGRVINKVNKVAPNVFHSLEIDSFEVGGQNWTQNYQHQFKQHLGYDLVKYLPVYAGKFIDSAAETEALTWDIREFNNKLMTENYFQYFTELANKDGIHTYIEPYGIGVFNDVDAGAKADIPMGEFWLKRNIYMMASPTSAGHIYNKNIISAESFTATPKIGWSFTPAIAKYDNDFTWALGVNQFVFHRFVHQANTHVVPGMTMERWGAHIDRTQPWWLTSGKAWFEYIRRGQYLLRQGTPIADVLWYTGDAAPTTCTDRRHLRDAIPSYVNYDCLNREKLQDELVYKAGHYQLNHDSAYKVLYLSNHHTLYLDSVKKLYQFAQQGGVIIGEPVQRLAGRNITTKQQQAFEKMVDYIWSQPTTHLAVKDEKAWQQLYQQHGLEFDLTVKDSKTLYYTHRKGEHFDLYFVYNDSQQRDVFDGTFNVTGKIPELWNARTGEITPIATYQTQGKNTRVTFRLDPEASTFVVFRKDSAGQPKVSPDLTYQHDVTAVYQASTDKSNHIVLAGAHSQFSQGVELNVDGKNKVIKLTAEQTVNSPKVTIDGAWQVTFDKQYGFDQSVNFTQLINWKDHTNPEIQHYSGIADYQTRFNLPSDWLQQGNQQVLLDLGEVHDTAQVFVNGKLAGVTWLKPARLNITDLVNSGENHLTVKVSNTWTNRLIGDEQYPDISGVFKANGKYADNMPDWYKQNKPLPNAGKKGHRMTMTTFQYVKKDDPLLDAGLVGPVTLSLSNKVMVK